MTFEVEVAGRTRRVAIEPVGAASGSAVRFRVLVDGDLVDVEACRTELGLSLLLAGGRSVDVALTPRAAGEWLAQFPHVGVVATVDGRRGRQGRPGEVATTGAQRVVAPMPGRVVRVLVKAGDAVDARQSLVVIEAMKMENDLSSPKAGVVREVAIAEGASVEAGRLLVVVE